MWNKQHIVLIALCGFIGTVALTLYFSAPFNWMPLPPPDATAEQIFVFGKKYHTAVLIDTWLQQFGTILSVIFALALVQMAGTSRTLAGRLTLLASTVIVSLSLAEGTFALTALQAGDNGHRDAAVTCYELTNSFVHIFLLAPSLFFVMGFAIRNTRPLPEIFARTAIILGIFFQILGAIVLFDDNFILIVIAVLMLQNIWTVSASIFLLVKAGNLSKVLRH